LSGIRESYWKSRFRTLTVSEREISLRTWCGEAFSIHFEGIVFYFGLFSFLYRSRYVKYSFVGFWMGYGRKISLVFIVRSALKIYGISVSIRFWFCIQHIPRYRRDISWFSNFAVR
jgi:hypothetical protein